MTDLCWPTGMALCFESESSPLSHNSFATPPAALLEAENICEEKVVLEIFLSFFFCVITKFDGIQSSTSGISPVSV